jgi:phosphate-selective porin
MLNSGPSLLFRLSVLLCGLMGAATAGAQESGALIDALIRKGILTNQEAEDIRAELVRENNTVPSRAMAYGKSTDRLSVGMRMQAQYNYLDTEVPAAAFGPVATHHALLRRMYLSFKAGVGGAWGATVTYDFSSSGFDDAYFEWRANNDLTFNFGLRKVAVGYEERASSGDLRSIERSGVTRYFVEANNGRRLGAASYRIGAFLDGKKDLKPGTALFYTAAITNPERNETFNLAAGAGDNTNNQPAYWGTVGLNGRFGEAGTWVAGIGAGFLPDQGGAGVANLGRGFDLTIHSAFVDIRTERYNLMAEYLMADVERGASATRGARPDGYFIQAGVFLTPTMEAMLRFESLDSDGRGVNLSDVVRSAPAGGTMDTFSSWFAGANWYLRGNDLKYQLGVVYGKTKDTVTGAPAEATTVGVRSQMQVQF